MIKFSALIVAHKFVTTVAGWLLFSSIVDGMPKPDSSSGKAYRWFHASLNLLAGNVFRVLCAVSPRFGSLLQPGSNPAGTEE